MAIAAPRRVAKLAIINGVHPGPFQRSLIEDAAQQAASAYMHELRADRGRAASCRPMAMPSLMRMVGAVR